MIDDNLLNALRFVILRDLGSLDAQIAAYPDDDSLWDNCSRDIEFSRNLVLHLSGNLRHFIGATLGESGYVRDRPAEFATKGLSRDDLRAEVQSAIRDLQTAFAKLESTGLGTAYPLPIAERQVRSADFLVHLAVHLTYHLGQIDYHRRLLAQSPQPVDSLSIRDLPAAT